WQNVGSAGFSAGQIYSASLALDSSGAPYVAYIDEGNGYKATVKKFDALAGNWVTVGSAGFSAGQIYSASLALDSSGAPYVAYRDGGNSGKATVMKFDGEGWVTVGSAGFSAGSAVYTSLALDSAGTPYVTYMDEGNGYKATVKKFDALAGNWVTVGSAGFSAGTADYTSLALDSNG